MVTIYDLLEVNEKASKEEIEQAYGKLILRYHKNPKLTEQENAKNEQVLNKLKIAYDILVDDEKRAKYDKDLAKKRAEELIKNVSVSKEEPEKTVVEVKQAPVEKVAPIEKPLPEVKSEEPVEDEEVELSEQEKNELKKAAQQEFKENLKRVKKAEEEYNKAYNEAYNSYMRKLGYKVKEPLTLKRVLNTLIFIVAIVITSFIFWLIPPVRNLLIDLYNENIIIKALVDIIKILFNSIIGIFK